MRCPCRETKAKPRNFTWYWGVVQRQRCNTPKILQDDTMNCKSVRLCKWFCYVLPTKDTRFLHQWAWLSGIDPTWGTQSQCEDKHSSSSVVLKQPAFIAVWSPLLLWPPFIGFCTSALILSTLHVRLLCVFQLRFLPFSWSSTSSKNTHTQFRINSKITLQNRLSCFLSLLVALQGYFPKRP